MKITRTSMFTGVERTIDLPITEEQLAAWKSGTLIQEAMPELSPDNREFVMTGVTSEEWRAEFGNGSRKMPEPRIVLGVAGQNRQRRHRIKKGKGK